MKKVLAVLLLVSTAAFGFSPNMDRGVYVGDGTWKTPAGVTGQFKTRTTISKAKGGAVVRERLVILHQGKKQVENMQFFVHRLNAGFFDVHIGKNVVGEGYCMGRTCHMDVEHNGTFTEETFHFSKDGRIMRMGSNRSKDMTVAWRGQMRKQAPAPAPQVR